MTAFIKQSLVLLLVTEHIMLIKNTYLIKKCKHIPYSTVIVNVYFTCSYINIHYQWPVPLTPIHTNKMLRVQISLMTMCTLPVLRFIYQVANINFCIGYEQF
jgi:hypothetical protein